MGNSPSNPVRFRAPVYDYDNGDNFASTSDNFAGSAGNFAGNVDNFTSNRDSYVNCDEPDEPDIMEDEVPPPLVPDRGPLVPDHGPNYATASGGCSQAAAPTSQARHVVSDSQALQNAMQAALHAPYRNSDTPLFQRQIAPVTQSFAAGPPTGHYPIVNSAAQSVHVVQTINRPVPSVSGPINWPQFQAPPVVTQVQATPIGNQGAYARSSDTIPAGQSWTSFGGHPLPTSLWPGHGGHNNLANPGHQGPTEHGGQMYGTQRPLAPVFPATVQNVSPVWPPYGGPTRPPYVTTAPQRHAPVSQPHVATPVHAYSHITVPQVVHPRAPSCTTQNVPPLGASDPCYSQNQTWASPFTNAIHPAAHRPAGAQHPQVELGLEFLDQKTIDTALNGECVNLEDFVSNQVNDCEEIRSQIDNMGNVQVRSVKSRKSINGVLRWLESWCNYEMLMSRHFGHNVYIEMARYRSFIIGISLKYKFSHVAAYDLRHRQRLAHSASFLYSLVDHDLYVTIFDSSAVKSSGKCNKCASSDHTTSECQTKLTGAGRGSSTRRSAGRGRRGGDRTERDLLQLSNREL